MLTNSSGKSYFDLTGFTYFWWMYCCVKVEIKVLLPDNNVIVSIRYLIVLWTYPSVVHLVHDISWAVVVYHNIGLGIFFFATIAKCCKNAVLQHFCCKKMLQEILAILGMLQTKMLQTFQGKKIVANTNVANFLGNSAMLQKPNVTKKKPMSYSQGL